MIDPTTIVIKNTPMYYYKSTAIQRSMPGRPENQREHESAPAPAIDRSMAATVT